MKHRTCTWSTLRSAGLLTSVLCLTACTVPNPNANPQNEASDDDQSSEGQSDTSEASPCVDGELDCPCNAGLCDEGLMCADDLCVASDLTCGNGVVDPGEQCDDANADELDGCRSNCQLTVSPTCGNGRREALEFCYDSWLTIDLIDDNAQAIDLRGMDLGDINFDGKLDLVMANANTRRAPRMLGPISARSTLDHQDSFFHDLYTANVLGITLGRFIKPDRMSLALSTDGSDAEIFIWEYALAAGEPSLEFSWIPLSSGASELWRSTTARFEEDDLEWAIYVPAGGDKLVMTSAGEEFIDSVFSVRDVQSIDLGAGQRDVLVTTNPTDLAIDLYRWSFGALVLDFTLPFDSPDLLTRAELTGDALEDVAVIETSFCQAPDIEDCSPGYLHLVEGRADDATPLARLTGDGLPVLPGTAALTAADMNDDGRDDIVLYSLKAQVLELVESDPQHAGSFRRIIELPHEGFGDLAHLRAGDLNDDGVDDLAFCADAGGELLLLLSNP